jgi:hypothetical protein
MNKLFFSAVAAAAFATLPLAVGAVQAQTPMASPMADQGFMLDARIAGMKAALKLTPEQEKLWPPFETAIRNAHKMRMEEMTAHREGMSGAEPPSPIAMMTAMADHMEKMAQEMKKVAEAAKPFYDSLDATQKAHFGPLLRMLRAHGPGPGGMGPMEGMHGHMGMHGPMMMEQ